MHIPAKDNKKNRLRPDITGNIFRMAVFSSNNKFSVYYIDSPNHNRRTSPWQHLFASAGRNSGLFLSAEYAKMPIY